MHVYDKYCVFYLCIYIIILCLCEFVGWCNLSAAMVAYNNILYTGLPVKLYGCHPY